VYSVLSGEHCSILDTVKSTKEMEELLTAEKSYIKLIVDCGGQAGRVLGKQKIINLNKFKILRGPA